MQSSTLQNYNYFCTNIIQIDSDIYILFFRFFSIIGYYNTLNMVLCAKQWILIIYLFSI